MVFRIDSQRRTESLQGFYVAGYSNGCDDSDIRVADRRVSDFTVAGIAINRRIQISRGLTSVVMTSHIISVIFSKVFHRLHHLKSFTAGGNCWDSSCMTSASLI